ncbi:MAG: hypothetical protein IIB99_06090 [Planctomycetes bacterium]|nr:hypothetical protein [Planctomycetota bacterium]MCH8210928.1 hypothetical protein [Planctomycetota bacterium]
MNAQRRMICAIATAVFVCGCGGEDGNGDAAATPGDFGSLQSAMSETASKAIDAAKKEFTNQLETDQSKVDAAKAIAKTLSDEQLDKLIYRLDTRLATARRKLANLSTADEGAAKALQDELAELMSDIATLHGQAMARIDELSG